MALQIWDTNDADFRPRFESLMAQLSLEKGLQAPGAESGRSPAEIVEDILGDVRARGDEAVIDLTEKLDRCRLTRETLRVSEKEVEEAVGRCDESLLDAMRVSADRIRRYQEAILVRDPEPLCEDGRTLCARYTPVDSAGMCVPGASASLASSVLMNCVPAAVAGVPRVVMVTPPAADGSISDDRLAAAHIAGIHKIYRIGGAQAVAALAYGTETIEPVDFIAGPGNIFVTLAKRAVFGRVGIDALPGPSEVVVIADATADATAVAADLIAQAEHSPGSSVLLTPDRTFASDVVNALEGLLPTLSRGESARRCLARYSAAVVCRSMAECVSLSNELAPEHLEIITADDDGVLADIRHAGAIFVGPATPVAVGDYIAGPSHTLPTSRTARFSSGISANTFRKRSSVVRYTHEALRADSDNLQRLASAEGLSAHAASVRVRTDRT